MMQTVILLIICSICLVYIACDTGTDVDTSVQRFDIQKELQDIRNQLYHESTIRRDFDKELSAMARRFRSLSVEQTNAMIENAQLKKKISAMSQSLKENVDKKDEWTRLNDSDNNTLVVAFTVILSHDVTLGQKSAVIYDRVLTNIGKGYNNLTGIFTTPASGLYSVSVSMMAGPSGSVHLDLVRNGIDLVRLFTQAGRWELSSQTVNVHLKQNDLLWVRQHSGTSLYGREKYNVFSATLLRKGVLDNE